MNNPVANVLLVEDSPADALLLREMLAQFGGGHFKLTHVTSRNDALARLGREQFDVVLLDLGLPESHGIDTYRIVHGQVPQVAIIVLSGLDDEEVAIKTVQEGAQDYLVKGMVGGDLLVRAMRYAIERKRVQDELRLRNEQVKQDLEMAREFQLAFLPRKFPSFPAGSPTADSALQFTACYRPTGAVGGDSYDVLPVSDTQAGVFLCDVMGHGVRAALVTAIIRGLVEELKPVAANPGAFLNGINHGLVDVLRQTDTTMFATAFYMVADVRRGRIQWASAGHPSPLHVHAATAAVAPLLGPGATGGAVLGLFEHTEYATTTTPVAPGDHIVLFTDGLFEVSGRDGGEYGQERLAAAIRKSAQAPPERIFAELLQDVRQFSATGEFADDVCLVGVTIARLI